MAGIMKNQNGFILIEIITVIVLIGIIGVFTTFFLYTGIKGYMNTKARSEGALDAQMALDRISLELRNLNYLTSAPVKTGNASLSYKSEVSNGTRILKYNVIDKTIVINIQGVNYLLLQDVTSFNLSVTAEDLNQDGTDDVAAIGVGFHIDEIGKEFKTKIFPRYMVKNK